MALLSLLLLTASPPGWTQDTLLSLNDAQESCDPGSPSTARAGCTRCGRTTAGSGARTKSITGAGTKSSCAGSGRELMARGFSASHPGRFALLCGASEDESDWRSIGTFPLHRLHLRP